MYRYVRPLCGLFLAFALPVGVASASDPAAGSGLRPEQTGAISNCPSASSPAASYERTWEAVRGHFGAAGMPAPRFSFVDRPVQEMRVVGTAVGTRKVEIFETERLALAGRRGCREERSARECLVHEFVHVFQAEPYSSGEIRPDQIYEEIPEGLAEARAQSLMREVFGLQRGSYDEGVFAVYDGYARQVRKQFPPSLIRRGQFGDNWAANPRLIPWEEPNPVVG